MTKPSKEVTGVEAIADLIDPSGILRDRKLLRILRNAKARANRAARREAYLDCGMVRGRDSMGREIWE